MEGQNGATGKWNPPWDAGPQTSMPASEGRKMILLSAKQDTFLYPFLEPRKAVLEQCQLHGLGLAAGELQYGNGKVAYALTEMLLPPEPSAMAQ